VTLYGWVAGAGDALAEPVPAGGRGDVEAMAEIVRLARLNAAGAMLWRAETTGAADLLADLDGPIDAVIGGSSVPDLDGLFSTGGGTWAEEYLSAGSHIALRVRLLTSLASRSGKLGAMEAEVVVQAALRGTPRQVRDAAAAIVEAQAAKPTIVNGVLEALPLMPKTNRNAGIVEIVSGATLPDIDAGNWEFEARRAVVERLLELIAGHGVYARVDGLAGLLDEAYSDRLGRPGGSGSAGSQMPVLRGQEGARALATRWIASAERRPPATVDGITIAEIRGRRAARLSAADGLVQAFHAEQLALAEAMAQVIAGEGLGRAERVSGLLDEMRLGRTRAQSVLTQIEHTERMMLGLWVLRFGEEAR